MELAGGFEVEHEYVSGFEVENEFVGDLRLNMSMLVVLGPKKRSHFLILTMFWP